MLKEIINNCEEVISSLNISLKEEKSEYKVVNKQRKDILKYAVDGCIYKRGTQDTRCDYLLKIDNQLYFIELKGSDVKKGLEQLISSIKSLERYFEYEVIKARLITTKGIRPNRLNTVKPYRDLLKLIGTNGLVLKKTPFKENIN